MVQRWKPSWVQGRMIPAGVHPIDGYVSAADHARIVAEATAEARAAERRHWEARFRNAEAAHAAALAEEVQTHLDSLDILRAEHAAALAEATDRQRARDYVSLWSRLMLEDRKYRAALARAAIVIRQRLTDSDVFRLTGQSVRLHEWETVKPLPADKAVAPRTLTADDPPPSNESVVLDRLAVAHQRIGAGWYPRGSARGYLWTDMNFPVTLIHDGEDR